MKIRKFYINAINARIVYNQYGDHDKNGKMYVLKKYEKKIRRKIRKNPLTPVDLVQPLVIRVNVGDKVEINFKNKTENVVAIYIQGDDYDNQVSNEVNISLKRCTIVKKRKKIKYEWDAKREGTFLFYDIVDSSAKWHGLFGAIIVEPIGTTWTNPETGSKLDFGVNADIHHPYKKDWREYVTLFHYEPDVYDRNGNQSIDYEAGFYESKMAINYRTEPAKTVLRAYVGDPVKWKLINIGIKETPVFHFKNYQWRLEINNLKLTLTDSIFISPQQCIEFTPVLRTGSLNKTTGDVIWYCHFYPLFMQGMCGIFRVLDCLEDGTRILPDGTISTKLVPLQDRVNICKKDAKYLNKRVF